MGAQRVGARVESVGNAVKRFQRQGADDVGVLFEFQRVVQRQRAESGERRGAVVESQPFLGMQSDGFEPRQLHGFERGHAPALMEHVALAEHGGGDVRERAEVARRADGSLLGHHGRDAEVEEVDQLRQRFQRDAGMSAKQAVEAQQHDGAHHVDGQRFADADGVAADQVFLKQAGAGGIDLDGGEIAESRRHAVDDAVAGDPVLDQRGSPVDQADGLFGKLHRSAAARDVDQLFEGQVTAGKDDGIGTVHGDHS